MWVQVGLASAFHLSKLFFSQRKFAWEDNSVTQFETSVNPFIYQVIDRGISCRILPLFVHQISKISFTLVLRACELCIRFRCSRRYSFSLAHYVSICLWMMALNGIVNDECEWWLRIWLLWRWLWMMRGFHKLPHAFSGRAVRWCFLRVAPGWTCVSGDAQDLFVLRLGDSYWMDDTTTKTGLLLNLSLFECFWLTNAVTITCKLMWLGLLTNNLRSVFAPKIWFCSLPSINVRRCQEALVPKMKILGPVNFQWNLSSTWMCD
jgi:hypothetical protein